MENAKRPRLTRKQFLGLVGASAAWAAGCSNPERGEIVPFTKRPGGIRPGVPDIYASTFSEGLAAHAVLVKTREGRPIHVQGNDRHPALQGKTSLRAVADLFGLYDPDRLREPRLDGRHSDWGPALARLVAACRAAREAGRPVLLLTGALLSPTRKALVEDLRRVLPGLRHAAWEPALGESESAALKVCLPGAGKPRLNLERAKVILAVEADFLGADRPEEIAGFAANRTERSMNRLYSIEGALSLTGANADHRIPWRPSRAAALGFALARALHQRGVPLPPDVDLRALASYDLDALAREQGADPGLLRLLADDLKRAGTAALVVAGPSLPPQAHAAACLLNAMLGAEGRTVDHGLAPALEPLADIAEVAGLLRAASRGEFAAAIFWGINTAYIFPDQGLWNAAVAGIPLKARIGQHQDETARVCQLVLPEHHWLESWNDFESSADVLSLQQPAVSPLYDTRQGEDILLDLARGLGSAAPADYRGYLMARWRKEVYPAGSMAPFGQYWSAALHDGVLIRQARPRSHRLDGAAVNLMAKKGAAPDREGFELILAPAAGVFDGRYANNSRLQEHPDPISKLSWGNAVSVGPADARRLGIRDGDLVALRDREGSWEIPALVQPGQAPGVLSAALGYGRQAGSVASGVGTNLYPLLKIETGTPLLRRGVRLTATGRSRALPLLQRHSKLEGRDIVRSLTWAECRKGRLSHHKDPATLYPLQKFPVHKWAMAVDLSACVGCQACMLACQSENNVAVVGPERVLRGREMHWLRVDRYYAGADENPQVLLQPMLCQHCDDAPCENVCPVAATTHSDEGLNQMAYNRCVGTRYCQNNCPYKVRRFNFFEYTAEMPEAARLAFNPEVTVRPRGVMEKCTFCVQRIEEAKMTAKAQGRRLRDGDIEPACAAACPARAIVFGDLRDPGSRVSRLSRSDRGYLLLEELGVRPSVTYLADMTNPAREGNAS